MWICSHLVKNSVFILHDYGAASFLRQQGSFIHLLHSTIQNSLLLVLQSYKLLYLFDLCLIFQLRMKLSTLPPNASFALVLQIGKGCKLSKQFRVCAALY